MKHHVLDMTVAQLAGALAELHQPPFRARQVAAWVWQKHVTDLADMTDLSAELRAELAGQLVILSARLAGRGDAPDGTVKLLLELADGERIECVAIPAGERLTACVSCQVGCAIGCGFCATPLDGLKRNLTAGEIVEQVFWLQAAAGRRVTNVVFMGMGEPLANYDATVASVRAMIDPQRLGLSARHVTVSTVGLPKQIRRLAGEDIPITLAISVHAPNDALRRRLIPLAARHSLADVISAAKAFYQVRHREVTLEYVLLSGVNDSPACADELAGLAGQLRCNVNVIRYNPVEGLKFAPPDDKACRAFVDRLGRRGANAHLRASRGLGASAACGQLRQSAKHLETTR
jgi:23S rRNA (adenine2503-C2)-methyltransferase